MQGGSGGPPGAAQGPKNQRLLRQPNLRSPSRDQRYAHVRPVVGLPEVGREGRTIADIARELGCDWHTVMDAVVA